MYYTILVKYILINVSRETIINIKTKVETMQKLPQNYKSLTCKITCDGL